ncbi:hypothetical protein [Terriglobus roseus]|nr:hypothetical protein [Terriglobus roseus]
MRRRETCRAIETYVTAEMLLQENLIPACASSDIIRIVEHLLNLLWFTVVSVLFACTVLCNRRGMLRCSLPVALGVVGLLAIVLFPAVSMTDDLQRAKMAAETSWQQADGDIFPGLRPGGAAVAVALLPFLLLAMLFGAVMRRMESLFRRRQDWPIYELVAIRPQSPRPPPSVCIA